MLDANTQVERMRARRKLKGLARRTRNAKAAVPAMETELERAKQRGAPESELEKVEAELKRRKTVMNMCERGCEAWREVLL